VAATTQVSIGERHFEVTAPHVLREYSLLADGARGALVGPRGEISWLCAPRWDSGSVFSSLIGGQGVYAVTPRDIHVWGGYYEPGTLIWRSRWVTHDATLESREALAYPAADDRVVLMRRLLAGSAPARFDVLLRPRGDYDRDPVRRWTKDGDCWTGRTGGLRVRWSGAGAARPIGGGALGMELRLEPGTHHDLVLEIAAGDFTEPPPAAERLWQSTAAAWADRVPSCDEVRAASDVRHNVAVLHGLTGPCGTVAAATTSLPERFGADRNYDYRYVWVRDQSFVGLAAAACGDDRLLAVSARSLTELLLAHGDELVPAYRVDGGAIPETEHLELPGYPGGHDVIGNRVRHQFQLDIFGESLQLFAAAAQLDRLDADGWRAAEVAVSVLARRWREPDAGIWEIEPRPWTHSRLTAAAGLRAIAVHAPASARDRAAEWVALADAIVADTAKRALHPAGHWQRAPEDPKTDAALLFPGFRGALPAGDPRTAATLDAYLEELTVDGYAYRFRHDDRPLHEAEGSFLLCGFGAALALHDQQRAAEAIGWFEQTRAACGPPQLFSEEYDSHQHQMRGNLPQAFVHALMIETAAALGSGGAAS
jgi:GH15 family glucan-1,4-alpha-glucosidase